MAVFSLQALHDEIVSDPQNLKYRTGPTWKADGVIASLINNPNNGAVIRRRLVRPSEITASLDFAEYTSLTVAGRQYLDLLFSNAGSEGTSAVIDTTEPAIFNALTSLFGAGTTTRAALLTKIDRQGSRAEVLWDEGITISVSQVARAANLS